MPLALPCCSGVGLEAAFAAAAAPADKAGEEGYKLNWVRAGVMLLAAVTRDARLLLFHRAASTGEHPQQQQRPEWQALPATHLPLQAPVAVASVTVGDSGVLYVAAAGGAAPGQVVMVEVTPPRELSPVTAGQPAGASGTASWSEPPQPAKVGAVSSQSGAQAALALLLMPGCSGPPDLLVVWQEGGATAVELLSPGSGTAGQPAQPASQLGSQPASQPAWTLAVRRVLGIAAAAAALAPHPPPSSIIAISLLARQQELQPQQVVVVLSTATLQDARPAIALPAGGGRGLPPPATSTLPAPVVSSPHSCYLAAASGSRRCLLLLPLHEADSTEHAAEETRAQALARACCLALLHGTGAAHWDLCAAAAALTKTCGPRPLQVWGPGAGAALRCVRAGGCAGI